jgi:hypothetical protein
VNGNLTPAEDTIYAIAPWRRADMIRDLHDLAAFLTTHLDCPVPDTGVFTIPIQGDDRAEREEAVLAVAMHLGVHAVVADGWLCAARQFGPVTLQARTPARKAAAA